MSRPRTRADWSSCRGGIGTPARVAAVARTFPLYPDPSGCGSDKENPDDRTAGVREDIAEARIATGNVELGNLDARRQQSCGEHTAVGRPWPERKGRSQGHEQHHVEKHACGAPVSAN